MNTDRIMWRAVHERGFMRFNVMAHIRDPILSAGLGCVSSQHNMEGLIGTRDNQDCIKTVFIGFLLLSRPRCL